MKEHIESLEITAAIREFQEIIGGFIQKVYQLSDDKILFRIHVPKEGKKLLLFKLGHGLFLTGRDIETPMTPSHYIMLLRKYLGNARITTVKQHEFDRVIVMELQGRQPLKLIFEVFGKGNLVLVGAEHILLPLRSETWKHRTLREGETYLYPPSRRRPFDLEVSEVEDVLKNSKADLVRTLAVEFNLGGKYAEEVCARMGVDKNIEDHVVLAKSVYDTLQTMKQAVHTDPLEPRIIISEDTVVDAVPFQLTIYKDERIKETGSYHKALDLAFKETEDDTSERAPSKIERRLARQKSSVENMSKKVEESMMTADLIYQNYTSCEQILKAIMSAREEGNREEVFEELKKDEDVLEINDIDEYVVIRLSGISDEERVRTNVKLDFRKDVNENAQKYYKMAKKNRKKIEGAKEAIKKTEREIEKGLKVEKKKERRKPTVKFWFDRYKWFISSQGNLVIAGKDTKTNEEVVKKYLEKYDRYAHADAGGAPSVVVKKGEGEISKSTLLEACQFAILHSKEWKRGVASGTAYWVLPEQVSKTAESGESLPTGAFVIRGKRNYIKNIPMKASLVEITYEDERKVMCAPSFTSENNEYDKKVSFIPGKKGAGEFANEMSDHFNVPVTEIQNILPPGGVKEIERI